jgi:hypothetical protein
VMITNAQQELGHETSRTADVIALAAEALAEQDDRR